jgi:hypothetical protein
MIVYNLNCRKGHDFEAWFRDSVAYDEQRAAGEVVCPVCGSRRVEKALMAPRVAKGRGRDDQPKSPPDPKVEALRRQLGELRRQVEENFDYVGDKFAEEARKIHYGETDPHDIYGQTSDDEAEALSDEGVAFGRLPWLPRHDS